MKKLLLIAALLGVCAFAAEAHTYHCRRYRYGWGCRYYAPCVYHVPVYAAPVYYPVVYPAYYYPVPYYPAPVYCY